MVTGKPRLHLQGRKNKPQVSKGRVRPKRPGDVVGEKGKPKSRAIPRIPLEIGRVKSGFMVGDRVYSAHTIPSGLKQWKADRLEAHKQVIKHKLGGAFQDAFRELAA